MPEAVHRLGLATFSLTAADRDRLAPGPATPGPPAEPDAQAWRSLLNRMVGRDFPSQTLFEAALRAEDCRERVQQASTAGAPGPRQGLVDCLRPQDTTAPSDPSAVGGLAPAPPLPGPVLTPLRRLQALQLARKAAPDGPPPAMTWLAAADCACVVEGQEKGKETVMGLLPSWPPRDGPLPVNFGRFHRITVPGPQVDETGGIAQPKPWAQDAKAMARTALRYGTRLDLLLHLGKLRGGLAQPPQARLHLAQRIASQAVALADLPLDDPLAQLRPLALPFWHEPRYAFDGITVMFGEPPGGDGDAEAARPDMRAWVRSVMRALISEMQRSGRPYALNLVVADHRLGTTEAYGFDDLLDYVELAQKPDPSGRDPEDASHYRGSTDITVHYLVPLHEPTTLSKKVLRARFDQSELLRGTRRVALLQAVVPVFFPALGPGAAVVPVGEPPQFNDDLAYAEWSFGGAAVWPLPLVGVDADDRVLEALSMAFGSGGHGAGASRVCGWVCPRRSALHLVWQLALLATLALALRCVWPRRATSSKPWAPMALWGLGAMGLLLSAALLGCDAAWVAWRSGGLIACAGLALVPLAMAGVRSWRRLKASGSAWR